MTGFTRQTIVDIFGEFPGVFVGDIGLSDAFVTGIAYDSRHVQPGNIFVAIVGEYADGHDFIPSAIEHGAVAVVGTKNIIGLSVPYLRVEDARFVLAHLAAAFYGFPARKLVMIGVTGTDGKTTTTNLIYQILLAAGIPAGMISTVNAVIGDEEIDTGFHVTTPEAPDIQRYLSRMVSAGITHVVLEATSHGLAQHRVSACEFDIAVITNITHEHLDYHGTYEAYWEAKGRLFSDLSLTSEKCFGNQRLAVLNIDDDSFSFLQEKAEVNQISYGIQKKCSGITAKNIQHSPSGLNFEVSFDDKQYPFNCHLIGLHNVSNCLAAIGATFGGLNIKPEFIQQGIENLKIIPGRMEPIDIGQDFLAVIDFAHTPNALRDALKTARQLTGGKVIAIFGSAGLRDKQKRCLMAEIGIKLADRTYLTAEDPRTESLDEILFEMSDAAEKAGGKINDSYLCIPDRREAIRAAVHEAKKGDVVISCGKGHEQSMCFEDIEYPWDDRIAMKAALSELLGIDGPAMPFLPTQDDLK